MPNPCSETLNWDISGVTFDMPFEVEIVDSKGVVVLREPVESQSVNVRALPGGQYECRFIDSKGIAIATQSFLVMR